MLEANFTELDNDFITLWSKFILTQDYMLIKNDLEKLAELGQVNAVQSYYLFLEQGDKTNKLIDDIVDNNFKGGNFNYLLAKTHKKMFEEDYNSMDNDEQLSSKSYELQYKTESACFDQFTKYGNPLVWERFNEISFIIASQFYRFGLRKELKKLYKQNPDSPEIAYAYAKNLVFYGKTLKKQQEGNEILTQLSNREFSKTLRNYFIMGDSQPELLYR